MLRVAVNKFLGTEMEPSNLIHHLLLAPLRTHSPTGAAASLPQTVRALDAPALADSRPRRCRRDRHRMEQVRGPRDGPSAKFFVVGVHRASTVSCSANVRAASRRQCRSSGRREERPLRRAPTAAVESDCKTMRHRRVAGERTAQRTASTVAPSSLSLM